ncbi:hypothetical protein B0T21DRAFT_414556 [Apiosordaria backusii]|uniref:Uncharacterized protein n=1 Tax=Apiosordaria backusii TaxID=314023 RepID=A0AA40ASU9_9PEZI|nr:hypothetical protein B0T21DRAFT_414556 [Apiosordaria backusii]
MDTNVLDWPTVEEAIDLNNKVRGQPSRVVFKPIARDIIQELHVDQNIAMSILLHDCREMLRQANGQYFSGSRRINERGSTSTKLTVKQNFFKFMLEWIQKSMRNCQEFEPLSCEMDILHLERDWDIVGYDGDWAIVGDANFA